MSSPTVEEPRPTPAFPDAWAPLLRRSVQLPVVGPGEPCPTTKSVATYPDWIGPVLGDGPIYPAFGGPEGVFAASNPVYEEAGWYTAVNWYAKKVLWVSDPTYNGIALVRGGRIDDIGGVRFTGGADQTLLPALRLTLDAWVTGHNAEPGWREWNSGSWFTGPGCYAYQVDGDSFTDVIVVQVVVEGS